MCVVSFKGMLTAVADQEELDQVVVLGRALVSSLRHSLQLRDATADGSDRGVRVISSRWFHS